MTAEAFNRFRVGDYIVFKKTFAASDFDIFSQLSGDLNPYHHDRAYSARQKHHGVPIVPLHMTLAPLSMIAGMDFPGEASLYLGHEIRAAKPVHYGEELTYSARLASINNSHDILSLRVLVIRKSDVVLDASMRVQARYRDWTFAPLHEIRTIEERTALITGASGGIGQAMALALARRGWKLLLQDRGPSARRDQLRDVLAQLDADVQFVSADFEKPQSLRAVDEALQNCEDLSLIIHGASAPVEAEIQRHIAVSFSALKRMTDLALPKLLERQEAAIVLLGSSATESFIPGWENYVAAKAAATQLLRGIGFAYRDYGIATHVLSPSMVATEFSAGYQTGQDQPLMPVEVADQLLILLQDRAPGRCDVIVRPGAQLRGSFGFLAESQSLPRETKSESTPVPEARNETHADNHFDRLGGVVRRILSLPLNTPIDDAAIGMTPGWDSLRHIELLLAVEEAFDTHFSSAEIVATHSIAGLADLLRRKVGGNESR